MKEILHNKISSYYVEQSSTGNKAICFQPQFPHKKIIPVCSVAHWLTNWKPKLGESNCRNKKQKVKHTWEFQCTNERKTLANNRCFRVKRSVRQKPKTRNSDIWHSNHGHNTHHTKNHSKNMTVQKPIQDCNGKTRKLATRHIIWEKNIHADTTNQVKPNNKNEFTTALFSSQVALDKKIFRK